MINMIQSAIVYFITIISLLLLSNSYVKDNNKIINVFDIRIIIIFVILFLFYGLRFDVGMDYMNYYNSYVDYYKYGVFTDFLSQEAGWLYILKYLASHKIHVCVFFGLIGVIQMYFLIFSFKNYPKYLPLLLLLFFIGGEAALFVNVIRQSLVVSVFLYIVIRYPKIKFICYCIIVMILASIHVSALFAITIYPLLKFNYIYISHYKTLCLIYILCCIIGLLGIGVNYLLNSSTLSSFIIGSNYDYYITSGKLGLGTNRNIGFGYLLNCLINLLIISNSYKYLKNSDDFEIYNRIFILFFVGLILNSLFTASMLVDRMLMYYTIFLLPVQVIFCYHCFDGKISHYGIFPSKYLKGLFIIISLTIMFISTNLLHPELTKSKYNFYFESNKEKRLL